MGWGRQTHGEREVRAFSGSLRGALPSPWPEERTCEAEINFGQFENYCLHFQIALYVKFAFIDYCAVLMHRQCYLHSYRKIYQF